MADPVVVVGVGHRLVVGRVEGGRHPGRHGEAPDGREVGPGGAQQVEPVALGLGQGLLVGEDVALLARLGEPERPDDAGGGAPRRVGHPVGVQARFRLGHEDALGLPAGEQVGRHGVAVAPARQIGLGQLDQDGVGLVARGQVHALGRRDDVVGRGDDLGDGRHLGPVAQPLERFETRHRATLAHRRRGRRGALPRLGAWTTTGWTGSSPLPTSSPWCGSCASRVFLWLLFGAHRQTAAAVLLAVLGATDWVDGYVARRYGQVSTFGKVLDPTADRLLVGTAVISIMIYGAVPLWFGIATIAREVLVSAMVRAAGRAGRGAHRRVVGGQGGHIRFDVRLSDLSPRRRDRLAGRSPFESSHG